MRRNVGERQPPEGAIASPHAWHTFGFPMSRMGKKNNVNPDHYKTGGRLRKGEDIRQPRNSRALSEQRAEERKRFEESQAAKDAQISKRS